MLQVTDLHAGYGSVTVLSGVNLRLGPGEVVAVLGRNGAGKTTLLKAILGLLPAARGSIVLEGRGELQRLPAHRRARAGLAYVPQGRQIFPRLTVRDNLRAAALASGQDPRRAVAETVAEFPALEPKLAAMGGSLSGGQQQILALARALVTRPRVLLLDEPTEGIQPSIVDLILQKVRDINARFGVGIILVEQNLEFATGLAGRAYIMAKGRLALELPAQQILQDQELQHEYLGV